MERSRAENTRLGRLALIVGLLPAVLSACGDIFDVDNPGAITSEDLDDARMLNALLNVPQAAAQEHYGAAIVLAGYIGNDTAEPGTCAGPRLLDIGLIDLQPNTSAEPLYDNLGADQWIAQEATRRIRALVPNPDTHRGVGRGYFWDAYLMLLRADLFAQVTFSAGPPKSPAEVYQMAIDVLGKAIPISKAANDMDYVAAGYAAIARAERALFFETGTAAHLARAGENAGLALATQPNFRLNTIYAPPGGLNGVWNSIGWPKAPGCGGLDPHFIDWKDKVTGSKDPRIQHTALIGIGPQGPFYYATKYTDGGTPLPAIRWQEARLIIAESRLETGDLTGAVAAINTVRTAAGLAAFQSADRAAIKQQVIYERQTEFWLEGHDWPDLRRYGIFPDRWNDQSKMAGIKRRLPISVRERDSNPNFR